MDAGPEETGSYGFYLFFRLDDLCMWSQSKAQWHRQGEVAPQATPSLPVPTTKPVTVTSFLGDLEEYLCLQCMYLCQILLGNLEAPQGANLSLDHL